MKTQHTPGPWNIHKCEPNGNFSIYASGPLAYTEKECDARLIAAAPDLLKALKDVMSDPYFSKASTRYEHARAAIAKAEGIA